MPTTRTARPLACICTRSIRFLLLLFLLIFLMDDVRLHYFSSSSSSSPLFPLPVAHALRLQSPFLNSLTNLTSYNYSRLSDPSQLSFMLGRFSTSIIKQAFATFANNWGTSKEGNMVILDPYIHTGLRDEFLCSPLPETLDLSPEVMELNGARGLEVRNKLSAPDPRYPYLNTSVSIKGAMVFASRGNCPFEVKAYWAQRAGANGLVVVNLWPPYSESDFQNNDDLITMPASGSFGDFLISQNESLSYSHSIPSVFITQYNFANVYRVYLDNIFNQIDFDQRIQRLFPTPCNNATGNCAANPSGSTGGNINSSSTGTNTGSTGSNANTSSNAPTGATGSSTGTKKPKSSSSSSTGNQARSSTSATGTVQSSTGATVRSSTGSSARSSTAAGSRRLLSVARQLLQSSTTANSAAVSASSTAADQSYADSTASSTAGSGSTGSGNSTDPNATYLPRFTFVQPYVTIDADAPSSAAKQDEQDLSSFRLAAYFLLVLPSLWCLLAIIYVGRRCGSRVREEARRQQRNNLIPTVKFHLIRAAAAADGDGDLKPSMSIVPSPSRENMHDAASETNVPQVNSASLVSRHLSVEVKEQEDGVELTAIELNAAAPTVTESSSVRRGDAAMSSAAALALADDVENEDVDTGITMTTSVFASEAAHSQQSSRISAPESVIAANPASADSALVVGIDSRGKHHRMTGITCAICISDFEEGESLKLLPCTHGFHVSCIDPWLEKSDECAVCRASINSSLPEGSRCARWCCPLPSEVNRENQQRRDQFQRRIAARNEAMEALRARSGVAEVHQSRSANAASPNANANSNGIEHQLAEAVVLPANDHLRSAAVVTIACAPSVVQAQSSHPTADLPPEQFPLVSSRSAEPDDLFLPIAGDTETNGPGGVKFHLATPDEEVSEPRVLDTSSATSSQEHSHQYYASEISSSLSNLEQVAEFVGLSVTGRDGSAALLQLRLGVESYSNGDAARTLSPASAIELIKSFMVSLQILTTRATKRDCMELIEGCIAMESTLTYVQEQIARRK